MRLESGVVVAAGLAHCGAARRLVHRLKYDGVEAAARVLAAAMAPRLMAGATALVPVPRSRLRVLRHGIDPAAALARALSTATGVPVVDALAAGWWWPRHAGNEGIRRRPPFRRVRRPFPGAVLIDDVVTSGATMAAAAAETDLRHGLVATSPGRVRINGAQRVSEGGPVTLS